MNVQFYMPTRVVMGEDCIAENAELLKTLGKRAIIVTGRHSAEKNGSLRDVTEALSGNGQDYILFNKVMSNPTIACVYEGAAAAKQNQADFVIAIGGGSPMDAAKAIALLARRIFRRRTYFWETMRRTFYRWRLSQLRRGPDRK